MIIMVLAWVGIFLSDNKDSKKTKVLDRQRI